MWIRQILFLKTACGQTVSNKKIPVSGSLQTGGGGLVGRGGSASLRGSSANGFHVAIPTADGPCAGHSDCGQPQSPPPEPLHGAACQNPCRTALPCARAPLTAHFRKAQTCPLHPRHNAHRCWPIPPDRQYIKGRQGAHTALSSKDLPCLSTLKTGAFPESPSSYSITAVAQTAMGYKRRVFSPMMHRGPTRIAPAMRADAASPVPRLRFYLHLLYRQFPLPAHERPSCCLLKKNY